MKFVETPLSGAFTVEIEPIEDKRGFFARAWCQREFEARGLSGRLVQVNISFNRRKGTLRGMHWQRAPHEEDKLIRCTRGAIFDVAVDLRPGSATYLRWFGAELTEENHRMLWVPRGFAHGFQVLEPDTEVLYQHTEFYAPGFEAGARYDDALFGIQWPHPVTEISDRDEAWPAYERAAR